MQEVLENSNKLSSKVKKVTSIDFNCNLGQGFGIYQNELEFDFLDYVSSVNIAAGFHAGDPVTIKNALLKAKEKNVVIGASIGFSDLQGFGMRAMKLSEDEIDAVVIYQVGALMSFAKAFGLEIEYVRPHGAMYKMASEDFTFSCSIAKAIKKCSQWLTYVGASGDVLAKVGDFIKIPTAKEVSLDKFYTIDGNIDFNSGKINDFDLLSRRLLRYMQYSQIDNISKGTTFIEAETINFTTDAVSLNLIKKANEIISPKPFNYGKVENSGWV